MHQNYCMLQNPENYQAQFNKVISELSASDHYFILYYKPEGYYKTEFPDMKPYPVIYQQESTTTFKDLMDQFTKQHPEFDLSVGMNWQLYEGLKLPPSITVQEFKKELREESVDGKIIFVYLNNYEWVDEAAVTAQLKTSKQFNGQTYEAPFVIQCIKYYMYLPLNPQITNFQVKSMLQKEIARVLKGKVDSKDIEINFQKNQKITKATDKHLKNYNNSNQQKFIVSFNKQIDLKRPPSQNNTSITIRGQGIKQKMFEYDLIKDMKLSDVIEGIILDKKQEKYAIIIEGQLLRFNQQLSKLDKFLRNDSKVTKHIIGYYVNECLAFQFQYKKLVENGQVNIQKIHIKQKDNIQRIRQCDKKLKARAFSATQSHFKNTTNVQPILFYTSEVHVVASDEKRNKTRSHLPIYCALNTFMRTNSFCDVSTQARYKPWEYKFAAHLYFQQKNIPPLKNKILWRGIKYEQKCKINDHIHFQQFSSTSTDKKQAEAFATKGIFMILNAKYAHPIKQYSFYQTQEQALVEPFSTWKVRNIWKLTKSTIQSKSQEQLKQLNEKTYQAWRAKQKGAATIDLIIVEELEKPRLPQMKSTVFLLVDDKPGEGKLLWQKIEQIKNTTVMTQLLSTAQLKKWFQQQSSIVNDPDIEIVMITNMTRVQDGKKDEKAGVYAIDTFYKYRPKGTVFVYIGWVEGTVNKLKEHKYIPNPNLRVSNQFKDMVEFLKEKGLKRK